MRLIPDDASVKVLPPGYQVKLHGHILDSTKDSELTRQPNADGVADFGLVRAGAHTLKVFAPWGEGHERTFQLPPGRSHLEKVTCPAAPADATEIQFKVQWPAELQDKKLWLVCDFDRIPRDFGGQRWGIWAANLRSSASSPPAVAITDTGEAIRLDCPSQSAEDQENYGKLFTLEPSLGRVGLYRENIYRPPFVFYFGIPNLRAMTHLTWTAGRYQLATVLVGTNEDVAPKLREQRLTLIGGRMGRAILANAGGAQFLNGSGQGFQEPGPRPENSKFRIRTSKDFRQFEVQTGQENLWTIEFPENDG